MSDVVAKVTYKFVDGAHFFVATDPQDKYAKGLCVASTDPGKAFDEVSYQLKVLAKKNLGEDIEFFPPLPKNQYLKWIELHNQEYLPDWQSLVAAKWKPSETV